MVLAHPPLFPLKALKSLIGSSLPPVTEPVLTMIGHSVMTGNENDIPISVNARQSCRIQLSNSSPELLWSLRVSEVRFASIQIPAFLEKPAVVHLAVTPRPWESLHISAVNPDASRNFQSLHLSLNMAAAHNDHFSIPESS
jgi:hypothetical protein